MAAFLSPANRWIESTFLHATTSQQHRISSPDSQQYRESGESQNDHESQYGQTESTVPAGLLASQQYGARDAATCYQEVPSRQSKIVQIVHRGGSGWDGSPVKPCVANAASASNNNDASKCPPYVILHDGEYSAVAFLSEEAMSSIGMNVADDGSCTANDTANSRTRCESDSLTNTHKRTTRARRHQRITLRDKSLVSVNHYTVSTIHQCLQGVDNQQHSNSHSMQKHTATVLNSLEIPSDLHSQLSPLKHILMCIYVIGSITVIGGENGGLIGEFRDIHCSVEVRRALKNFADDIDNNHGEIEKSAGYNRLMVQLERVHFYFQQEAGKKLSRDDEVTVNRSSFVQSWPWSSRLEVGSDVHDPTSDAGVERGNVTSLMNDTADLDEVLGDISEEEGSVRDAMVGRTSTGTFLAQWDIDQDSSAASEHKSDTAEERGNAEELFSNYEHVEDVLEFTQEPCASCDNDAELTDPKDTRTAGGALLSPGNCVPFIGIDQMITSQSQASDDSDDESATQPLLTQVDTYETAVEDMSDLFGPSMEGQAEQLQNQIRGTKKDNDERSTDIPPSQDVSLTNSQSINPEQYFSAQEDEPSDAEDDENNCESQFPIRVKSQANKPKSKRLRHSQIAVATRTRSEQSGADFLPNTNPTNTAYESDDSDAWMKIKKKPNAMPVAAVDAAQSESQVAGEGSEENSPLMVGASAVDFDCGNDELVDTDEEVEQQQCKPAPHQKHESDDEENQLQQEDSSADDSDDVTKQQQREESTGNAHENQRTNTATNETPEPTVHTRDKTKPPKKVIREFNLSRFLSRSKRLCRRG